MSGEPVWSADQVHPFTAASGTVRIRCGHHIVAAEVGGFWTPEMAEQFIAQLAAGAAPSTPQPEEPATDGE